MTAILPTAVMPTEDDPPPPTEESLTRKQEFAASSLLLALAKSDRGDAVALMARAIDRGAPFDVVDEKGFSPLACAAREEAS